MTARFRDFYGATPVHLLAHLVALPLAAFALWQLAGASRASNIFIWLLGSVLLHDLLVLPFYGALDRAGRRATGRLRVAAINHIRFPVALSALMLIVFFGVISGRGSRTFTNVSGLSYEGYLGRWLLVTAVLFAVSGALYLLRLRNGGGSSS